MDPKKRRSSLRKTTYSRDDENTVVCFTPRLKRRISFSGKHLVREFHREEEPKTWDNSYEISDHLNVDENGAKLCFPDNSVIHCMPLKQNTPLSESLRSGNTSTTRDLINIPYQNTTLCIENSVDITLFDSEKQYCAKTDVSITNINSFSLDENEMLSLPASRSKVFGERTIDFMQDLKRDSSKVLHNEANNSKERLTGQIHSDNEEYMGITVCSELMNEADYVKFTCSENKAKKEGITIYMNDSLSASNIEIPQLKRKTDSKKTLKRSVGMHFSTDTPMDLDKENVHPSISSDKNITVNNSCFMDIEKSFDLPNSSPNIERESKEFQDKLDRISFVQHFDSTNILEDSQVQQQYLEAKLRATQRPTINFNQLIESSPAATPESITMKKSINLYEDMTVSPTIKHVNIPESLRKKGPPLKLVIRKICTPLTGNSKNAKELEKQRTLRYKMKQEQDDLPDDSISIPISNLNEIKNGPMVDNSLNFSINSAKNISLSPESNSSLLIPSEYKAYNFKQLNDEIERGKIQLFSKTPTTDRKVKEYTHFTSNIFTELGKQRRTLFFEDDITITPDKSSCKDKPSESNDYFDFKDTRGNSQRKNNIKCRFSQADDLMLDNTSFLTRARLGDETTSRNSTKRDITQLNDLEIFDETLKEAAIQLGNAVLEPKTGHKSNFSLHSMFKDAKPVFKHAIGSMQESFIDLSNDDSRTNINCNNLETIHLNEKIGMSDNEINEHVITGNDDMKLEGEKRRSPTLSPVKEWTIYLYNDMELNEGMDPRNGNASSRERKTIYQNTDMEVDDEIEEIIPMALNINQEEDTILDFNKKKIARDRHTKHFEDDQHEMTETSDGLTFVTESDRAKERNTIFFEQESCLDIHAVVSQPVDMCIENINTEYSEIQIENKPDNTKNVQTFFNNSNPSGMYESRNGIQNKNLTIENNENDAICSEMLHSNVQGVISMNVEIGNTTCNQSYIDHKNDCVDNIENEKHQLDLEITEVGEYRREIESDCKVNSKESARKTLYFNQCIETDNLQSQSIDLSEEYMKNRQKKVDSRLTLLVHRDMDLDESIYKSNRDEKLLFKCESMNMESASDYNRASNPVETASYFNDETVEMDLCEPIQKLCEKEDCPEVNVIAKYSENTINHMPRKTVYFSDDVYQMECSIVNVSKSISTKSNIESQGNLDTQNFYSDISNEEHDVPIIEQKSEESESQLEDKKAGTQHLSIEAKQIVKNEKKLTTHIVKINNDEFLSPVENMKQNILQCHPHDKEAYIDSYVCTKRSPQTMLKKTKVDGKYEPASICSSAPKSVSLNVLARQSYGNNAMASEYNNFIQKDNCLMTPVKGSVNRERLCEVTPRLSLTEFLAYEKRTKRSSDEDASGKEKSEDCQYNSPVHNETSIKRLPTNLTPLLSMAKKRQLLVLTNCDIDESMPVHDDNVIEINKKTSDEGDTNNQNGAVIVSNTPVLQTPTKQRKSRIPVSLSSGKKTHPSLFHPNNDIDFNELSRSNLVFEDIESLTQSIQEIRRATTYAQVIDTVSQSKNQITSFEFQQPRQHLMFEDNPITISDVSVYFQDRRKSVVDICGSTTCIDTEETKGKSFQKRYMNLTCDSALEDIDQTRLSLVRTLSDEDVDECEGELKESNINTLNYVRTETDYHVETEKAQNNTRDVNRCSTNQLSNVSTMCRKCKRCQETFLNETTSSMTDSFVLPSLPPVPTLDFDRLRRLRRRPHLSDVNILWQRVSLDRTMINLNNVSGDSSLLFPSIKECADADCSISIKPIQKYLSSVQRYVEILDQSKCLAIRPSLINRLDDIVRIYLPNWIFDCQMQSRGVMFFSHRNFLTFSIILTYEEIDTLGMEIQLKTVQLDKSQVPMMTWKPIDFILDFQLKLNLPFDLLTLCESSNEFGILNMMRKIDHVCTETNQMGIQLQRIIFANRSSIIRDEHRTLVRKIVRRVVSDPDKYKRVENTELRIELLNVKKLCFKDITMPSLYNFCEDIHLLPIGLQFLNEFLHDPLRYLKDL